MFYPSTCAAIHRSSFIMHYYCNAMFLVKQKAYLELSVAILEIPCFIVGHAIQKEINAYSYIYTSTQTGGYSALDSLLLFHMP